MRVVFVASLVHSGSTVVDLLLGAHGGFVGLGEMWSFLHPELSHLDHAADLRCSCGAAMQHCRFWGAVIRKIEDDGAATTVERYDVLTETFGRLYPGRALVDSSKSLHALRVWLGRPAVDLRVLHLVRDVRGWATSMADLVRRTGEPTIPALFRKYGWRAPRRWLAQTTANRFRQWYIENRRVERFVELNRLPGLVVSYDELCRRPERVLPRLCAFLGVEPTASMLSIADSASHIALGNRMLRDERARTRLRYDDRWRRDRRWVLPAMLMFPVMRYNKLRVHEHDPEPDA